MRPHPLPRTHHRDHRRITRALDTHGPSYGLNERAIKTLTGLRALARQPCTQGESRTRMALKEFERLKNPVILSASTLCDVPWREGKIVNL